MKAAQKCPSALVSAIKWRVSSNILEIRVKAYLIKSL